MINGIAGFTCATINLALSIIDGGKSAVAGLKPDWWFGISPEGFGTIAMLVNFVISVVVSRMTAAPPIEVQDIVEDIRIPSGAGEASSH